MMKRFGYIIATVLVLLSSCDKFDWHNPYDPECPKELFTPSSPGATMEGNSVKLTWSQSNDDISGFALFRSAEGEPITNLTQTQKSATQYLDASVTPGKKYTYYVLAVAGTNKSDTIKAEITPVFPITISTGAVSELAATSAKVGGNITSAGGGTVTSRGICWSTTQNPTVNNSKTTEGTGAGEYISTLSGLLAGTTYYARAYGENSRGIVYGSQVAFTTLGPPILTTTSVTNITSTSATSGGTIISDGGSPITAKGVVWSTSPNPTIDLATKTNDGTGVGNFTSTISNLAINTKYFVRAYAINGIGTKYGEEISFNTSPPTPTILESLRQGLVAYYPFNGNANDESGNGNNGIVNGATLTSDRFGNASKAYQFLSNNSILLQIGTNVQGNNPRAISFWFKPVGANFATYTIYKGGSNGDGNDFTIWFRKNVGGTYQLYLRRFVDDIVTDSIPIFQDWTHFIVSYDGTLNSNIKFFINGSDYKGRSLPGTGRTFNTASVQPEFGHNVDQLGVHRYLDGFLDDIRIYNRALTQEEITYLANN